MKLTEEKRQDYLNYALELTDSEKEKAEEYASWLPPVVIDAHAHSNLPEHVDNMPEKVYSHMMSTYPSFSIEESQQVHRVLYPETRVRTLRFAHAFRGIAHRAVNSYLLDNCPMEDKAALYGLPEDVPYTIDMLGDPRVGALKMYYAYLEPNASCVYDIFKPDILAAAETNDVPIILHTPKVITESAEDVIRIKADFPNLKVSIAHLGLSKFDTPDLQGAYDMLADGTDVMMDTALNPSPDVCSRAIQTFGAERIMYGTDEPLNLLRSVPYLHPDLGQRITTSYLYHWQDPIEHERYSSIAKGAVHCHWLCLDALKAAIHRLPQGEQDSAKQAIFHDNAKSFFNFRDVKE